MKVTLRKKSSTYNNENQSRHYENMPIQIYGKFYHQKMKNFQIKNSNIFHISAQSIECEYSLEPPWRGGSNEYPQSMFLSRNKKNNVYPCKPQLYYIKVGFKGVKNILACFRDVFFYFFLFFIFFIKIQTPSSFQCYICPLHHI